MDTGDMRHHVGRCVRTCETTIVGRVLVLDCLTTVAVNVPRLLNHLDEYEARLPQTMSAEDGPRFGTVDVRGSCAVR